LLLHRPRTGYKVSRDVSPALIQIYVSRFRKIESIDFMRSRASAAVIRRKGAVPDIG
jgi:hypothetical protein